MIEISGIGDLLAATRAAAHDKEYALVGILALAMALIPVVGLILVVVLVPVSIFGWVTTQFLKVFRAI